MFFVFCRSPELSGNEEIVDPAGIAFVEVSFPRILFPNEDKPIAGFR